MGTLWTDARLWPTELDQNQNSPKDGFPQSQTISQTRIRREEQPHPGFAKTAFALGVATIITIFVSAIYLTCRYLL
jgi:hypothetical protein